MPKNTHPCPNCGGRDVRIGLVGERADIAAECADCGLRGPRARSVNLEALPNIDPFFVEQASPPEDEIARLAWNRLAAAVQLASLTADLLEGIE